MCFASAHFLVKSYSKWKRTTNLDISSTFFSVSIYYVDIILLIANTDPFGFSATWPPIVRELAQQYTKDAFMVVVGSLDLNARF